MSWQVRADGISYYHLNLTEYRHTWIHVDPLQSRCRLIHLSCEYIGLRHTRWLCQNTRRWGYFRTNSSPSWGKMFRSRTRYWDKRSTSERGCGKVFEGATVEKPCNPRWRWLPPRVVGSGIWYVWKLRVEIWEWGFKNNSKGTVCTILSASDKMDDKKTADHWRIKVWDSLRSHGTRHQLFLSKPWHRVHSHPQHLRSSLLLQCRWRP